MAAAHCKQDKERIECLEWWVARLLAVDATNFECNEERRRDLAANLYALEQGARERRRLKNGYEAFRGNFTDAGRNLGSANLDASGTGSLPTTELNIGANPIIVAYSGGGNFAPATSPVTVVYRSPKPH